MILKTEIGSQIYAPEKRKSLYIKVPLYDGTFFPFLYIGHQNIFKDIGSIRLNYINQFDCELWRLLSAISKKGGKEIKQVLSNYSCVYVIIIMIINWPFAYYSLSLIVLRSFDKSYFSWSYSLSSNYWYKVVYNIML